MLCERHGSGTTPRRSRRCLMRRARLRPRQLPRRRQPTLKQPAGVSLKASMRLAERRARLAAKAKGVTLHTRNADPTCLSGLPYRLAAKAILRVSNLGCQLEPVFTLQGDRWRVSATSVCPRQRWWRGVCAERSGICRGGWKCAALWPGRSSKPNAAGCDVPCAGEQE